MIVYFLQEIACMMGSPSSEVIFWAPEVAYALHIDTQILSPQF